MQTPVGMTSVHVHHNEAVFPEPYKFKPERWLQGRPQGSPPLDRYLVAFSKGSRQCIGMQYVRSSSPSIHLRLTLLVLLKLSCWWLLPWSLDGSNSKSYSRLQELMSIYIMISLCQHLLLVLKASGSFSSDIYMVHAQASHYCFNWRNDSDLDF